MPRDMAAVVTLKVTRQRRIVLWLARQLIRAAMWLMWGNIGVEFKTEEAK